MKQLLLIFLWLLVSGCNTRFVRRLDAPYTKPEIVVSAVKSYSRMHGSPCSEPAALLVECLEQPIRVWAVPTAEGVAVCYQAMGLPLERGKLTRRMDDLENMLKQRAPTVTATESVQAPAPPFLRS